MAELKDLIQSWDNLKAHARAAEEVSKAIPLWVIGLDAGIIGATIPELHRLQEDPLKFKIWIFLGLLLLTGSFAAGAFFKKREVELAEVKAEESRIEVLIANQKAMSSSGDLSPEGAQIWMDLATTVKKVTRLEDDLAWARTACFNWFFAGTILLSFGLLALLVRPELHEARLFLRSVDCEISSAADFGGVPDYCPLPPRRSRCE